MIRFRIDEAVFGTMEAQRHLHRRRPQAQVAISMFGEAQKLTELAKATGRSRLTSSVLAVVCNLGTTPRNCVVVCPCPYK